MYTIFEESNIFNVLRLALNITNHNSNLISEESKIFKVLSLSLNITNHNPNLISEIKLL